MKRTVLINYLGRKGGGCLDSYESALGFMKNDMEVIAIVSAYSENIEMWRSLPLKELIEVKTYQDKISFVYRTIWFLLSERYRIKKRVSKLHFDFMYCPMLTLWAGFLNKIIDTRKIIVNHDPIPHSGEKNRFIQKLSESAYGDADAILVHSKLFQEYVEKTYKKECCYIPLGRHNLYKTVEQKRSIIQYQPDTWKFLFFGRISRYKGLDILAGAYKRLWQERKDIECIVAGNGDFSPYQEAYEDMENVRILNQWIADEEIESLFQAEKLVVVLPYLDATQSGVALVAMDYGIPVIATNTGGLSEQIVDGETGILIKPGNVEELYMAMKKIISDKELYEKLSVKEREYAESLSWKETALKIDEIVRKMEQSK